MLNNNGTGFVIKQIFKIKAYLGYLTVGDGGLDHSMETALANSKGGVDIIEIGIPYTDLIDNSPTIQKTMDRALQTEITSQFLFEFVEKFQKESQVPLVLLSYYNSILKMGEEYLQELKQLGVQGMILVDVPYSEVNHLGKVIDHIPLVTPLSTKARIEHCTDKAESFVYYACQKGTTGDRQTIPKEAEKDIRAIQSIANAPVVAGFGIRTREMAHEVIKAADGFVVGSHFVKAMGQKTPPDKMVEIVKK